MTLQQLKDSGFRVPAMPMVAMKALNILSLDSPNSEKLADVLGMDQAFASRLLHIANSPYFNRGHAASSVQDAVMRVGFEVVKMTTVVAALDDMRRTSDSTDNALWEHSVGVAVAAKVVAEHLGLGQPEAHFVHGLLHDIGKAVIKFNTKDVFESMVAAWRDDGRPFCEIEAEIFGFTHADIGRAVAEQWGLPADISDAMALHHSSCEEIRSCANAKGVLVVKVADRLCRENGMGFCSGDPRKAQSTEEFDALGLAVEDADKLGVIVMEEYPKHKLFILGGI